MRRLPLLKHIHADHFDESGVGTVPGHLRTWNLEGVVAKRKDGLYTPEETSWVKIRNRNYSQIEGRRELLRGGRAPLNG